MFRGFGEALTRAAGPSVRQDLSAKVSALRSTDSLLYTGRGASPSVARGLRVTDSQFNGVGTFLKYWTLFAFYFGLAAAPFWIAIESWAHWVHRVMRVPLEHGGCGIGFLTFLNTIPWEVLFRRHWPIYPPLTTLVIPWIYAAHRVRAIRYFEISAAGFYTGTKRSGRFFAWGDAQLLTGDGLDALVQCRLADLGMTAEHQLEVMRPPEGAPVKRRVKLITFRFPRFEGKGNRMETLERVLFSPGVPEETVPTQYLSLMEELDWLGKVFPKPAQSGLTTFGWRTLGVLQFYLDHPEHRPELSAEDNLEKFIQRAGTPASGGSAANGGQTHD